MNKQILILQFRTDKTLEHERVCFNKSTRLNGNNLKFVNVFEDSGLENLPDLDLYDGLIISGSGQYNLTDLPAEKRNRLDQIRPLVEKAVNIDFPTLGICFGHQMIAEFFSGEVKRDSTQAEGGPVEVKLNSQGRDSALFKDIPDEFWVNSGHKDSVTKLPSGAKKIASSKNTDVAAFRIRDRVYGVQFHPELSLNDVVYRFSLYPEYLNGKTLENIRVEHPETPYATKILKNFVDNI